MPIQHPCGESVDRTLSRVRDVLQRLNSSNRCDKPRHPVVVRCATQERWSGWLCRAVGWICGDSLHSQSWQHGPTEPRKCDYVCCWRRYVPVGQHAQCSRILHLLFFRRVQTRSVQARDPERRRSGELVLDQHKPGITRTFTASCGRTRTQPLVLASLATTLSSGCGCSWSIWWSSRS